jgi:hypothetical protein
VNRRARQNKPSGMLDQAYDPRVMRLISINQPNSTITQAVLTQEQGNTIVAIATAVIYNFSTSGATATVMIPESLSSVMTSTGFGGSLQQQTEYARLNPLFDEYRVDGFTVHYVPNSDTTGNSVNLAIMSDYDNEPSTVGFTSMQQVLQRDGSLLINPDTESLFVFKPNRKGRVFTPWMPASGQTRGGCLIFCQASTTNINIGNFVIKWRTVWRGSQL